MVTLNLNQVKQLLNEYTDLNELLTVTETPDGKVMAFFTNRPEEGSLVLDPNREYSDFYGSGMFVAIEELIPTDLNVFETEFSQSFYGQNQNTATHPTQTGYVMTNSQADGYSEN